MWLMQVYETNTLIATKMQLTKDRVCLIIGFLQTSITKG